MAGVPRFPPVNGGFMPPRGMNRHPYYPQNNEGYYNSPRGQGHFDQDRGNGYFRSSDSGFPTPPYQVFQNHGPYQHQGTHGARFPSHRPQKRPNRGGFNNNNFPPCKKEKIDKRDRPENNKYFCDTCDRGFKSDEKFQEHVDGHETCSVEGCSYIAAPKLVRMHFDHQHRTGLAKKIWQAESKEDVAKWIQERKRKFPTVENITKKKIQDQERQERGEVLETKSFGKFKQKGNFQQNDPGETQQRNPKRNRRKNRRGPKPTDETTNENQCSGGIPHKVEKGPVVDPLSLLAAHNNSSDEKEDTHVPVKQSNLCGALGALANTYDTSEDENDPKDNTEKKDLTQTVVVPPVQNKIIENTQKPREPCRKPRGNQGRKKPVQNTKKYTNKSLLEKLLANDIRHERNMVLQCIKFIVKSNFFEEKVKAEITEETTQTKGQDMSKNKEDSVLPNANEESKLGVKGDSLEAQTEEDFCVETNVEDCEIWDSS